MYIIICAYYSIYATGEILNSYSYKLLLTYNSVILILNGEKKDVYIKIMNYINNITLFIHTI